jgi:signal transduction histidine kinase
MVILDDILDLAKIISGQLNLESIPFDLGQVAADIACLMKPRADAKGIDLVVRREPAIHHLVGDPVRLSQVLSNLVSNAIKFTDQGQVLIDVECEALNAERARLRLVVEDSGIGLTEAQMEPLFERFTQADTSTTRRYGGSGLGLSICRELVELMGGEIGVESRVGQGSTFWAELELPVATMD